MMHPGLSLLVVALGLSGPALAQDELEGQWEEVQPGDDAVEGVEGEWEEVDPNAVELEGDWEGAEDSKPAPAEDPAAAKPGDAPPTDPGATDAQPADAQPADAQPAEPTPTDPAEPVQPGIVIENAPDDVPIADLSDSDADASVEGERKARRVGDPFALTRREPLLGQWGFEAAIHYGLVGTGPTRLTNDFRLGIFDWWELRTTFAPYPAALMSRFKIGSQQGPFGALVLDGGLASLDAGVRLIEDEGEAQAGPRAHLEGGVAYSRALGPSFSVYASGRFRYRLSPLDNDGQNAIAIDAAMTYDVLDNLALTLGLGYSEVLGTPVRELAVNFVETDRPGMSHFLLRDDGWSRAVTVPIALTYGRVDSFDVDLFITPRVYPEFGVMFGAGIRWRIAELFNSKKLTGVDTDVFDSSPK